jgi:hypothetical protein
MPGWRNADAWPRPLVWLAQGLGMVWALPVSVLGLAVGALALAAGAQVHVSRRAHALVFSRVPWGPGGALTLGNVILDTGECLTRLCHTYAHAAGHTQDPPIVLADHECAHVYQTMLLGPLMPVLYWLSGGVSVHNPFEQAADRYALSGRGWWPWA